MNNIKAMIFIGLSLFSFSVQAQKEGYNWTFGDSLGLNFNNLDQPEVFFSAFTKAESKATNECGSTISTASGELLYYTKQYTKQLPTKRYIAIMNKNHEVIVNGDKIPSYPTYANGAIFLSHPVNDSLTYLVHIGERDFTIAVPPLPYHNTKSIVVQTLKDNQVIEKNKLIYEGEYLADQITAVRHSNGKFWWVLAHDLLSDMFLKFLITDKEIIGPEFQHIGSKPTEEMILDYSYHWLGEMVFSPNGEKLITLASNMNCADLFDFDRCSGQLSNFINLSNGINGMDINGYGFVGGSFSPNNDKLYLSKSCCIYQFDLKADTIKNSRVLMHSTNYTCIGLHQLAPNGKIYIANGALSTEQKYLYGIHKPDLSYPDCEFDTMAIYLKGKNIQCGLPNLPDYQLSSVLGMVAQASKDTTICNGDSTWIQALDTDSSYTYHWYLDDTFIDSSGTPLLVVPDSTTTYTLKVREKGNPRLCDEALDFVTVYVLPDSVAPCTTVSREVLLDENKFTFYPNPVKDQLNINYQLSSSDQAQLEVYDLKGTMIYQQKLYNLNENVLIPVHKWSKGLYLFKISLNNQTHVTKKILVTE